MRPFAWQVMQQAKKLNTFFTFMSNNRNNSTNLVQSDGLVANQPSAICAHTVHDMYGNCNGRPHCCMICMHRCLYLKVSLKMKNNEVGFVTAKTMKLRALTHQCMSGFSNGPRGGRVAPSASQQAFIICQGSVYPSSIVAGQRIP